MARFEAAETELEAEIVDVVQEANSFKMGWGGMIFATATEMAHAEKTREIVMSSQKIRMREGECSVVAVAACDSFWCSGCHWRSEVLFFLVHPETAQTILEPNRRSRENQR
jgi:hypothetical protein